MSFAGIDLGNSRLKVAGFDSQGNPVMLSNDQGELSTPSVVFFEEDTVLYGQDAVNAGLLDPARCVTNWKRHMGTDTVLCTRPDGSTCRAVDVAKLLLTYASDQFQRRTGDVLSKAAVSVPANYSDAQKRATLEAARAAGIEVTITPHEPTAASFGNQVQRRGDGLVVLFDLGGGTFDVSLVRVSGNTVDVIATNGEPRLGGQDFNAALQDLVLDRFEAEHGCRPTPDTHALLFQELQSRIEQAKLTLTARESAQVVLSVDGTVFPTTVTRDAFRTATQDLVARAMECAHRTFEEADVRPEDLREVIPVGGASQMPCFLEAIEQRFGRKPTTHCEPNFAVAMGTLVIGRITEEQEGKQVDVGGRKLPPLDVRVRDVTAHAVGVCTLTESQDLVNTVILGKGKPIPSDHVAAFSLAAPGQTGALIQLLQGPDGVSSDQCKALGHFELTDLTPVHDRPHPIDIRLSIDKNGVLTAEAIDAISEKRAEMRLEETVAVRSADPRSKVSMKTGG